MNKATISADIISFTSLGDTDRRSLEEEVKIFLSVLAQKYKEEGFYGRNVQGDYIECAMQNPRPALRIALLLKVFIKSLPIPEKKPKDKNIKYFLEHGIRLALAVAPLSTFDAHKGIIDGEAIYLSGRAIKNMSTAGKKKVIIKNTMFFCSLDKSVQTNFEVQFAFLDFLISKLSKKQSQVIFHKLMGLTEKEIGEKLEKTQSTISQHSNAAGWQAIEKSVIYFENHIPE